MSRFVCIHGHFYQPPRENPWTGEIERQPSAGEDHDWNYRIARQCYIPNGHARVVNEKNETLRIVNNYAHISFNFGPTLLSWYERAHPEEYRLLLEADAESARRLKGHGNAIAQAYNHMILPLADPRDRITQVRWGLEDFRHRFKREPEALWLPETACDAPTLGVLIDHGLKYAILAPSQAQLVRPLAGESRWTDVENGGLDTRRAYRWFDKRPGPRRSIDIFFYHGPLSQAVAFGRIMADSRAAADRLEGAFTASGSAELVSVCTDGETYGHHDVFAEMGLAHLVADELPARGVSVVNFGYYLAQNPPAWEVEIQRGTQGKGTSWSCAHGVGRWMEECGCGSEGKQQKWRRPLREALDWLRGELAELFEGEGGRLFRDPWAARDAFVAVLLDPAREPAFLAEHLRPGVGADSARAKARALLESQKFAMFMYTSCGWFFADIAGLEAVQNLKYAARAVELAREAGGPDLEAGLLKRLAAAPCNVPELGDGAGVYRRLVQPSPLLKQGRSATI